MSVFSKIGRALGFGSADDPEYDPIYEDTDAETDNDTPATPSAIEAPAAKAVEPVTFDADMQQKIFTKVVEVFDAALPDFIGKACNQEAQRKMIFDSLDQGIKDYLASIGTAAEAYCDAQWKAKQNSMAAEMDAIRLRAGEIEKQSNDIKQKQLSADRQKRALTERVHDLESQIGKLESEREQFELENRSLVNRIKVANVQQEDLEKAQAEILALRTELNTLKQDPSAVQAQVVEDLNKQIAEMTDGIDSLKEQLRVSEEMREDQRKRSSEAATQVENLKKDLAKKTVEVNELNELIKDYDEITNRMSEFDQAMTKMEEKIKTLNKTISQREAEIEGLKATIDENKRSAEQRELTLKKQLDDLRPAAIVAEMQVDFGTDTETEDAPRISEDDLNAMEEAFENGDWFTKTPPAETPSMRSVEAEAEFGYRAPRRKSTPVQNPDQLSLF